MNTGQITSAWHKMGFNAASKSSSHLSAVEGILDTVYNSFLKTQQLDEEGKKKRITQLKKENEQERLRLGPNVKWSVNNGECENDPLYTLNIFVLIQRVLSFPPFLKVKLFGKHFEESDTCRGICQSGRSRRANGSFRSANFAAAGRQPRFGFGNARGDTPRA